MGREEWGWLDDKMSKMKMKTHHTRENPAEDIFGFVSFGELYVVSGINGKSSFIKARKEVLASSVNV